MSDEVKTVRLAGRDFPIPVLAIKQNQHVEPLATKNHSFFARTKDAFEKAKVSSDKILLPQATEEEAADFSLIVFHALTRGTPTLTLEQFHDMPVSMREIMAALMVCLEQSGLYRKPDGAPEAQPQTGEAASPSTGTGLSPSSVTS